MTVARNYLDYLGDILDAIEKIEIFIENSTYQDFIGDAKTSFAVIRALEIIGEATKKLPLSVKEKYPEVPWREMAGIRNKMIHEYFGVNLAVIWKTIMEDLSKLKPAIQHILADMGGH